MLFEYMFIFGERLNVLQNIWLSPSRNLPLLGALRTVARGAAIVDLEAGVVQRPNT